MQVRSPAVAGLFYPLDTAELQGEVAKLLSAMPRAQTPCPKALIVPHAGYVYSGVIAASGYARIAPLRKRIERVVLLGPAHRVALHGLALPSVDAFLSPLGAVALDAQAMKRLAALPQVMVNDAAHAQEHSLEVHLPFLQSLLGEFRLVPLAVGNASAQDVAEVLDCLWSGEETLIVVSSDLSHYLPYARACARDQFTVESILRLKADIDHEQACGATAINGLMLCARARQLRPELLDLRNSGDTAGDKSRVVGYAALGFYEPGVH
jgi:MEMO1 family protein